MKHFIVALALLATSPAIGADLPRTGRVSVLSLPCSPTTGGNYHCRRDFRANCRKGSAFPIPRPPEKEHNNWPHSPTPPGLTFQPTTAQCIVTEMRGKAYIRLLASNPRELQIEYGCEANIRDDAFVYGYCEARAARYLSSSSKL